MDLLLLNFIIDTGIISFYSRKLRKNWNPISLIVLVARHQWIGRWKQRLSTSLDFGINHSSAGATRTSQPIFLPCAWRRAILSKWYLFGPSSIKIIPTFIYQSISRVNKTIANEQKNTLVVQIFVSISTKYKLFTSLVDYSPKNPFKCSSNFISFVSKTTDFLRYPNIDRLSLIAYQVIFQNPFLINKLWRKLIQQESFFQNLKTKVS